jgi:hypothetical protein
MAGEPIADGVVLVRDGKIAAGRPGGERRDPAEACWCCARRS